MSRARTLKEIEDRRAQYARYIWMAVLLSITASIVGIAVYIALGLPSYFLFGQLPSAMLITSFVLSILSAIAGYLSKSGVLRGEYGSASKLLLAAMLLSIVSIVLAASAFTPLMNNIVLEICQTRVIAESSLPSCIYGFRLNVYAAFGAYLLINVGAVITYIFARKTLGHLLAYYAPRQIKRG